ncbi:PREDICTED: extracellular calcium-sensing receptor-like [Nanorana parkeri]|uniref:extracellular calcium-sensing receptor-like n=1 Tax=Nanorana parkeri TaxID=125878 RepID=UPI000854AF55|nr:PREDICTED: extracellular calcium-sensing receptor-like [Nanorana parkeri]
MSSMWVEQAAPQEARFRTDLYKSSLALVFATKEVNENPDLLPNITLGFQMYDSCFFEASALQATIQVTSGDRHRIPNYNCGPQPIVPAIIGDLSTSSMAIARVLGLWKLPQVSYIASHPSLSNKREFPSFFRTTISTESQPQALIELCKKFRWTWIGLLVSSSDNYIQDVVALKREAAKNGICISFLETVSYGRSVKKMPMIIEYIRKSTVKVIILYCSPAEGDMIFVEVVQQNLTEKLWIGIESWYTSPVVQNKNFWKVLNGTIGIAKSRNVLPHFSSFLNSLNPSVYPKMLSITQFWGNLFKCKWRLNEGNTSLSSAGVAGQTCTGLEKIVTDDIREFSDSTSQAVYMAHNALYAIVHALHSQMSCKSGEGPFKLKSCADKYNIQPWQLLYYLKRVHFVNTAGKEVFFDANGDIYGNFDILNWHVEGNQGRYVKVGSFDTFVSDREKLSINESSITWVGSPNKVPYSVCSDNCSAGYWKAPQKGQPACCFDCIPCPEGMISNETNSISCYICPEDQWPNNGKNKCDPKVIEFLSYEEPLGMVMSFFSILFSVITGLIFYIFLKFRDTVVVKVNNRNLSYLILLSLKFCFLCPLMFIGYPTSLICTFRQSVFGIIFSFCISCILAKTIIVVLAFKATNPGSNLKTWVSFKTAIIIIVNSTFFQMLIMLTWVVKFSPFLEHNYHILVGIILIECNEGSVVMFYCTVGYLGVLATISFVVAFLARNLPDSYNEAKYITFSMLTFLSVWSTFIPAYLSTKGKYIVAVEIFAILLSSFGLLCCIFAPKCYIILLKPSMNTREYLTSKAYKK